MGLRWDIFCRVIDNHGDIGVCWRLACDLAERGEQVRLWVDDASALRWMAPGGRPGVQVIAWTASTPPSEPGDVVIEAFGCDLPTAHLHRMARRTPAPRWINLEYLSAERYVERSHGLASPQLSGPGRGLSKWFFYPGFTGMTGGLIRERDLAARQQAFDAVAWRRAKGIDLRPGERVVSLFCYANPALPALVDALAEAPTLLLAAGVDLVPLLGADLQRGQLRAIALPWLTQRDYDHLLWSCDLNGVRGEDSFVRAQWAGRPMLWQAYPQDDGAHHAKVDAFIGVASANIEPVITEAVSTAHRVWNGGVSPDSPIQLPPLDGWRRASEAWRDSLRAQEDLTSQLMRFAADHG